MYFKFEDYNRNEQREIVYEVIRQKYLHDQQLNNFGNNCKLISDTIRSFESGTLVANEVKTKFQDFYNQNKKEIADEVLFYFYNVADGVAEKFPSKTGTFKKICDILKDIIDVDAIGKTITPPEDKMGPADSSSGGFTMIPYTKYPTPKSYVAPPPPSPTHDFKNPYPSLVYKSICDWVRYKIFDIFEQESNLLKGMDDLEVIYLSELIPDSNQVESFPQASDGNGGKEDLDFENPGDFVINNENSITFGGGGDWQEPMTFSLKVLPSGKIKAFDIHDDYNDDDDYGAKGILKLICKIFGLDINNYDVESEDPNDLARLFADMVANKDFKLNVVKDITTEDCVAAIVQKFPNESADFRNPKNWKRKSKIGSQIIIRVFENKLTKDQVRVTATMTQITKIEKI